MKNLAVFLAIALVPTLSYGEQLGLYRSIDFSKDIHVYQTKTFKNGFFHYEFELDNQTSSNFYNITFSDDCAVWYMPRKYSPINLTRVVGQPESKAYQTNNLLGSPWDIEMNDSDDFSSPEISLKFSIDKKDNDHRLGKGKTKLVAFLSSHEIDRYYEDQPYCIKLDGKHYLGFTAEEEWKDIDSKIDIAQTYKTCEAQNRFGRDLNTVGLSQLCQVKALEIQDSDIRLTTDCVHDVIYKNRLENIDLHKDLVSLIQLEKKSPKDASIKTKIKTVRDDISKRIETKHDDRELREKISTLLSERKNNIDIMKRSCSKK